MKFLIVIIIVLLVTFWNHQEYRGERKVRLDNVLSVFFEQDPTQFFIQNENRTIFGALDTIEAWHLTYQGVTPIKINPSFKQKNCTEWSSKAIKAANILPQNISNFSCYMSTNTILKAEQLQCDNACHFNIALQPMIYILLLLI